MTREQLTFERVSAILDRLEDLNALDKDMAEALRTTQDLGEAPAALERKRNGKDPREATGGNE